MIGNDPVIIEYRLLLLVLVTGVSGAQITSVPSRILYPPAPDEYLINNLLYYKKRQRYTPDLNSIS